MDRIKDHVLGQEPTIQARVTLDRTAYHRECGSTDNGRNECPAAVNINPPDNLTEDRHVIECAVLNAISAGNLREAQKRVAVVLDQKKAFKRQRLECAPLRSFKEITS